MSESDLTLAFAAGGHDDATDGVYAVCERSRSSVMFDSEPRTMPYGTGVTLNDLYGNKIYLNEDPR